MAFKTRLAFAETSSAGFLVQVRTTKAAELQIETAYLWLKKRNPTYADK